MNFRRYFYSISENKQLSDKIYFNTGILNELQKQKILEITNGDHLTKFICDIVAEEEIVGEYSISQLQNIYNFAKTYNKQVFPILGLSDFSKIPKEKLSETIRALENRDTIIDYLKRFPSIAKRNLRDDIRAERMPKSFLNLKYKIEYILLLLSQLNNRDSRTRNKLLNKIFSSNIGTFDDVLNVIEDKSSLIGGKKITKNGIAKMVDEINNDYEMMIVYKSDDAWVVRVGSQTSIKKIGCNSLWCFTYGDALRHGDMFSKYSHNDYVYVIIDWKAEQGEYLDENLMVVVIEPLPDKEEYYSDMEAGHGDYGQTAYSLLNEPIDVFHHLERLHIPLDIFTFED